MADYQHILLAVDFSKDSELIGRRALDLAQRCAARLTIMHVVADLYQEPVYDLMSSLPPDIEQQLVENARRSLEDMARRLGAPEATCVVELGTPKVGIIQAATDRQADLIVLGSHGVHGLELLLGSTANAVLHSAPCDVLAVRVQR